MFNPIVVKLEKVPLSSIEIDPIFVPKSLSIPKHLEPDKATEESYLHLTQGTRFFEPLKVGRIGGDRLFLLCGYENYRAFQRIFKNEVTANVDVLILENQSIDQLRSISIQLRQLEKTKEPHLARLITLELLISKKTPVSEIKRMYNISKSASSEGKQLQRDMRLVRHKRLLGLVLGIEKSENACNEPVLLEKIMMPGLMRNSKISYNVAIEVLSILRDESATVDKFIENYLLEIDRMKALSIDEQCKPVFQWKTYDKSRVIRIANAVALNHYNMHFNSSELSDFRWDVHHDKKTGNYVIPAISYNIHDHSPENIRKIQEIKYLTELVSYTLGAHIARLRPVGHGLTLKVKDSEFEPIIAIPANIPNQEDLKYLNDIRSNKMLYYCNRWRILKCLQLHAGLFGYDNHNYDSISTFRTAFITFEKWWNDQFLRDIFLYYQDNPEMHPKFKYYIAIKLYLTRRQEDSANVYFSTFINDMLAAVFSDLDADKEIRRTRLENVLNYDRDLKSHSWDEIKLKLAEVGRVELTKDQLESLLREAIHRKENSLAEIASNINRNVNRLIDSNTPFNNSEGNENEF